MSGKPTRMIRFSVAFKALTGHASFPWQNRLYRRFMDVEIPPSCTIPTGLGKTSVIPIWLIALATQGMNGCQVGLPRRLIYIVNRRTVIDQATDVVERMRQQLIDGNNAVIQDLRDALCRLASAGAEVPVAVSTLRGELADNEEWKADPARPAIIIGTIDMVGSKLLFSGYGDGRYGRVHHAGLIGQDALIVHDESHLTPPFGELLRGVAQAQCQDGRPRAVRVMELSATARGDDADTLRLTSEDEKKKAVTQRLDAAKRLQFHEVEAASITGELVRHIAAHENDRSKVLVYVRSPKDVQRVANGLRKELGDSAEDRVAVLTGTIRGHERDELVRSDPVYRALLDHAEEVKQTVYLVSTSAGEVGIDLDADHMVCDRAPLDSMVQRLGRVNRRGGKGRFAQVDVVAEKEKASEKKGKAKSKKEVSPYGQAVRVTQAILRRWADTAGDELDVSPRNLRTLIESLEPDERCRAFSPSPDAPPLTDILLDAWSLTSVTAPMPGRPMVTAYLHGLTNDPPETYLAWRKEVTLLREANVDARSLREWFRACRVAIRERLPNRTDRVKEALEVLLKTHRKNDQGRDFPVVLLDERGVAEWSCLSGIAEKRFPLAYRTVVLPVEAGGLTGDGMLDGKSTEAASDVADTSGEDAAGDRRERWLCGQVAAGEGAVCERLVTGDRGPSPPQDLCERQRTVLQESPEGAEEEGGSKHLLLMAEPRHSAEDDPESARVSQSLDDHTRQVVETVERIADALELDASLKDALRVAARWHDRGKDRLLWQRFAMNTDPANPLGKSRRFLSGRVLGGYRHGFGSLLEAAAGGNVSDHPEADLILHLVASHHGWARPHFDTTAFDHERFSTADGWEAIAETMRRFGRLQHRFGRWGLAWLESLLRCADIAASKHAATVPIASPAEEVPT